MLGRLIQKDERNRKFALPKRIVPTEVTHRYWWNPRILDQGQTPQCVGFSGFGWLISGPVVNHPTFTATDLYGWAQDNDEWPGNNYDGTSALGLMKSLKGKGYVSEYKWAFDVDTMFNWLLVEGPLLFGTYWYDDMFNPDSTGFLSATGSKAGGHEYLIIGANVNKKCPDGSTGALRVLNSWGKSWGQHGRAWMSRAVATKLLADDGDCVTPTEVKLG